MRASLSAKILCFFVGASLSLLQSTAIAQVQVNQNFISQGPSPSSGPFEIIGSADADSGTSGTATGDIQAILLDPALGPDTIFIGSPTGGIWRTTDGGINWTPLADNLTSLSIASLGLDVTDPTGNTLIAGIGITSSGNFDNYNRANGDGYGGPKTGLLYSTDGGDNWTALGSTQLTGQSVISVAARGSTIMAATFEEYCPESIQVGTGCGTNTGEGALYGLYISLDGGNSFNLVPTSSGLPAGPVTSLVADPDPSHVGTFYAAVTSPIDKASQGVFVTSDFGATWSPVFTMDSTPAGGPNFITGTDQLVFRLATGPNNSVAIAVIGGDIANDDARLRALCLSTDGGASWTALQVPDTSSGLEAIVKFGITIDPLSPAGSPPIVYVSGDVVNTSPTFPSPVFRVPGSCQQDTPGVCYQSVTCQLSAEGLCTGPGPVGAVHADSRALVVDAAGNLLLVGDGGVYKLINPQSDTPTWTGLNSTLQAREPYQVGYGANADRLVVAAQDTGVAIQSAPNSPLYNAVQAFDGYVALARDTDDQSFADRPVSVYYTSQQDLDGLSRLVLDGNGNPVSPGSDPAGVQVTCKLPGQAIEGCGTATGTTFNRVVLNRVDPTRLAFVGASDVYVAEDTAPASSSSVDLSLTPLSPAQEPTYNVSSLAYGANDNPDALLAGAYDYPVLPNGLQQGLLYLSKTAAPESLKQVTAYAGNVPTSLVFGTHTEDFYVADSFTLWGTNTEGKGATPFTNYATDLSLLNITRPTSVEFISNNGVDALLVGGLMDCTGSDGNCDASQSPIAVADSDNGALIDFRTFGSGLPNTIVYQMAYNPLADVLAIASVGRGVWTLYDLTSYFVQADVLQFGLANNDSLPDASYLTDGTHLDGTTFARPLEKYGTGTLAIAGDAISYTGGTTIFEGNLQLGIGGTSGSILGDIHFCGNDADLLCDAILTFNRSDAYTFAGVISGAGGLVQAGTGITILSGTSSYTGDTIVNSGTLAVNGSIASSVFVNHGATLAGSGKAGATTILAGGTLSPGNGIGTTGTLKVAGDLLFEPGSLYLTNVLEGESSGIYVTGTATLAGTEVSLFQPGSLANSYNILSAAGGRAGTFDTFAPIGLPSFVTASLAYTDTDVDVMLQSEIAKVDDLTRNQRAVGSALDRAFNEGPGIPDELNAALFGLPASELPSALDTLSGEIYATTAGILADDSRYVRDALLGRMIQARYQDGDGDTAALAMGHSITVTNAADAPAPAVADLAFWIHGFGAWADYDDDGNAADASRQLSGFLSGMDAAIGEGWRLGAAVGYSQSDIDIDQRASSANVDTYYLAAYAGGGAGPVALRVGGAWGWHDIDSSRLVAFRGFYEKEKASYNGDTGQVFGEAAYPVLLGSAAMEPFAGLAFVHVSTDSFDEEGGVAALDGKSGDENVGYSTLGLRLAGTMAMDNMAITPHGSIAWQHAFDDVTPQASLVFAGTGTGFGVVGIPLAENSALLNAGLDLDLSPTITLGISYSGQFANELEDNAVEGRFLWTF